MIRGSILYLTNRQASLYVRRRGCLWLVGSFPAGESGPADLAACLGKRGKQPLYILADLQDESYQLKTIPYLGRRDRKTLLERELTRAFPGTSLAAAISLGHERDERKNEQLLLMALTQPIDLTPWLAAIAAMGTPLAGIYAPAQLIGHLLGRNSPVGESCLFVSLHGDSLRASLVMGGKTIFSRRVSMDGNDVAASIASETALLQRYLANRGITGREDPLAVTILAHPSALPEMRNRLASEPDRSYAFLDSHTVARRLGLHPLPDDDRSEMLFLQALTRSVPSAQFADRSLRQPYRQLRARRSLWGTAALVAGLALTIAGSGFHDSIQYQQEVDWERNQEAVLNERTATLQSASPVTTLDADTLRQLAGQFSQLGASRHQPQDGLRLLGATLDTMPEITLDELDWAVAPGTPATGENTEETMTLRGSVDPARASPGQLPAILARLIHTLEQHPGVSARIINLPADVLSGRATFVLQTMRRAGP